MLQRLEIMRLQYWISLPMLACLYVGCGTIPIPDRVVLGSSYQPGNIYRQSERLPESLRRVAILPLSVSVDESLRTEGREALQPLIYSELAKCKLFELVYVTHAELQQWTGRSDWRAEEKLPPNFFEKLKDQLGCNAVLFCELSQYRPYKPLVIGWQLKLIDSDEPRSWWSADEVFDAGEVSVSNAARRYYFEYFRDGAASGDSNLILSSPRRFGQYTLSALFATLPSR
jgi:hypothetical protein